MPNHIFEFYYGGTKSIRGDFFCNNGAHLTSEAVYYPQLGMVKWTCAQCSVSMQIEDWYE